MKIFLLTIINFIFISKIAFAIDITFNGNYSTSYTSTYKYTRTSYGLEIGLPINRFMQIEMGESFTSDLYEYNDAYRTYVASQGTKTLPAGQLTQQIDSTDTFTNLSIGLFNYYFSPSIYGGILNRKQKTKDIYGQESNDEVPLTWDAGASLSMRITRYFHLKITYRISPSGVNSPYGNPYYDQSYWGGITLSF
ncbi:hypothetical protein ACWNT8_09585 [Pigmentibacter ruber]